VKLVGHLEPGLVEKWRTMMKVSDGADLAGTWLSSDSCIRTRRRILVADDLRTALCVSRALERSNRCYEVAAVGSMEDAVAAFDHRPVDLLLLDPLALGGGGWQLASWARECRPSTNLVLATTCNKIEAKVQLLGLDVTHCIEKPFSISGLVKVLGAALAPSWKERVLSSERSRRDLLMSHLFHDMRTPLTFLMNYAQILSDACEGTELHWVQGIQRHTETMKEAVDIASMMVEWSLDWAASQVRRVDVHALVEDVVRRLTLTALEKGISLRHARAVGRARIVADAWALGMLVNCVVLETIRCTASGGEISARAVRVGNKVVIGIAGRPSDRPGDGAEWMGLGFAKKMAETLCGELEIHHAEQHATGIDIVLPARDLERKGEFPEVLPVT
jgi:CheY-like chemotaxis protein